MNLAPSGRCEAGQGLRVHVIHTTAAGTRAALLNAGMLANGLGAELTLLAAHVVPYPLPLHTPASPAAFTEQALSALAAGCGVDAQIKVLLCRDRDETLPKWLARDAIVVAGVARRIGPGSCWWLLRRLRKAGYKVIVVERKAAPVAAAAECGGA